MTTLNLTMSLDNDAFAEGRVLEIEAVLLRALDGMARLYPGDGDFRAPLKDSNGNTVGHVQIDTD